MAAPWKALLQLSLRKNERLRHSKYFQVATVRPDGLPSNRTVVYRGFLWDTDRLTFVTDSRSNKVEEVLHCPWAEIAWYFPETREQYRFLGRITIVSKDEKDEKLAKARTSAWKNMSDPGRQQFTWPTPGIPRLEENSEASTIPGTTSQSLPPSKDDLVADPFCLCFMDVSAVDHLELRSNVRRKFSFDGVSNTWLETEVNP